MSESERAWMEPLIRAVADPAFRLTMVLIEDRQAAEDILQEAFLRAWQSPRTPREPDDFRRWIYHIVVNLTRDYRRRVLVRQRFRLLSDPELDPAGIAEANLLAQAVDGALDQLSTREREAVVLRFFENASYQEVASVLEMREGACRVLVHRALKKIGARLSRQGLTPEEAVS